MLPPHFFYISEEALRFQSDCFHFRASSTRSLHFISWALAWAPVPQLCPGSGLPNQERKEKKKKGKMELHVEETLLGTIAPVWNCESEVPEWQGEHGCTSQHISDVCRSWSPARFAGSSRMRWKVLYFFQWETPTLKLFTEMYLAGALSSC